MKLKVASVCNYAYSVLPQVKAVTDILERWGYDYEPVIDPLWFGWPSKMRGFIEIARYEAARDEYTHLMFIDASDVVLLAGPDEVMERYLAFGHPWVYNAERFIWSPDSFQPEDYPTPDCTYRYLNAGASIGEIGHVVECFNKWTDNGRHPPVCKKGDQDWMAARFLEDYPDAIKLDTGCELFQTMCGSQAGDKPFVTVERGRAHNRITDTDPVVIHFNGGTNITDPDRRGLWEHLVEPPSPAPKRYELSKRTGEGLWNAAS